MFIILWFCLLLLSCSPKPEPLITSPFKDNFNRNKLGVNWRDTSNKAKIINGRLYIKGAHNKPIWLKRRLPKDVIVEFDAWARDKEGDIKVELFGDGRSFATSMGPYRATSYVLIFGGWHNTVSIITKFDEHSPFRKERKDIRVLPNKRYHFKIIRENKTLVWYIDGDKFMKYTDRTPLYGRGHYYFGFNNWESGVFFDNLFIAPKKK